MKVVVEVAVNLLHALEFVLHSPDPRFDLLLGVPVIVPGFFSMPVPSDECNIACRLKINGEERFIHYRVCNVVFFKELMHFLFLQPGLVSELNSESVLRWKNLKEILQRFLPARGKTR